MGPHIRVRGSDTPSAGRRRRGAAALLHPCCSHTAPRGGDGDTPRIRREASLAVWLQTCPYAAAAKRVPWRLQGVESHGGCKISAYPDFGLSRFRQDFGLSCLQAPILPVGAYPACRRLSCQQARPICRNVRPICGGLSLTHRGGGAADAGDDGQGRGPFPGVVEAACVGCGWEGVRVEGGLRVRA